MLLLILASLGLLLYFHKINLARTSEHCVFGKVLQVQPAVGCCWRSLAWPNFPSCTPNWSIKAVFNSKCKHSPCLDKERYLWYMFSTFFQRFSILPNSPTVFSLHSIVNGNILLWDKEIHWCVFSTLWNVWNTFLNTQCLKQQGIFSEKATYY